jgi:hypothetical protein
MEFDLFCLRVGITLIGFALALHILWGHPEKEKRDEQS